MESSCEENTTFDLFDSESEEEREIEVRPTDPKPNKSKLVQKSVEAEGSMGKSTNLPDTPKNISAKATSTPTGTTEINTMIFREI